MSRPLIGVLLAALLLAVPLATPARASAAPNIVLILSDDQSYGTVEKMPYLRSRTPAGGGGWTEFRNAYVNNATCCPARATLLTGQWSHHHGVESSGGAPAFDDSDTIATRLDAAGYRTGFIGKYHLGRDNGATALGYIPPGWDEWHGWEGTAAKEAYYNYRLNENGLEVPYGEAPEDYSTDVLTGRAVDFVRRGVDGRPFFLLVAFRGPHNPWTAAPRHLGAHAGQLVPHDASYNEDTSDKPVWWASLEPKKPSNTDGATRKQWDTLLSVDNAVKAIHGELNAQHLMRKTVVFYLTDNGYSLGEHRYVGKVCAYDACTKTPLYVKYRGDNAGRVFSEVVGNEDLAATFAELARTAPPADGDGQSFADALRVGAFPAGWENEALLRGFRKDPKPGQPLTYWGLRTPGFKYVQTVDTGEEELYDVAADPLELNNVAGDLTRSVVLTMMRARLAQLKD
jgi:N-acetylglucosamine-6-sulfatase